MKTILLALAALGWQALDPVTGDLQVPEKTEEHNLVIVTLADTNATSASISVLNRKNFQFVQPVELKAPPSAIAWTFTGPPDSYAITVNAVSDGNIRAYNAIVEITARGPPEVDPENPVDPEQPEPDGATNAAIIYEGVPPVHGEAAARELRQEGTPCVFYNAGATDDPPAFIADQVAAAKANGLPALVVSKGDTIVETVDLPETKQAIKQAVNDQ